MEQADYSKATPEEREKVVAIVLRNAEELITKGRTGSPEDLRGRAEALAVRIRRGEILTGRPYKELLSLLQRRPVA